MHVEYRVQQNTLYCNAANGYYSIHFDYVIHDLLLH